MIILQLLIIVFANCVLLMIPMSPFWKLQTRCIFGNASVFKVKAISEDAVMFNLPEAKKVLTTTNNLKTILRIHQFDSQPQSIQYFSMNGADYIVGGCYNGNLQIYNYNDSSQCCILREQSQPPDQNYVNDIKHISNDRLINCYNNGTIAIWNLTDSKLMHRIQNVHKRYTYKLRRRQERMFSCGNDGYVVETDLPRCEAVSSFKHSSAVWALLPFSNNEVATAGLFGSVMFWDTRIQRAIQSCQLFNNETSFITQLGERELVMGDGRQLVKCDIKMMSRQKISFSPMLVSAEGIELVGGGSVVCGRGFQICKFNSVEEYDQSATDQFSIVDIEELHEGDIICNNPINLLQYLQQQNAIQDEEDEEMQEVQQNIQPPNQQVQQHTPVYNQLNSSEQESFQDNNEQDNNQKENDYQS